MASELKVNTLTGVSTAGSIAVTGEGNSTTTNLQQGLAKTWSHCKEGVNTDGFNVSSVTDSSTGSYIIFHNNDMANATYAVSGLKQTAGAGRDLGIDPSGFSASQYVIYSSTSSGVEDEDVYTSTHGDLA
jgi:hypothetical protein